MFETRKVVHDCWWDTSWMSLFSGHYTYFLGKHSLMGGGGALPPAGSVCGMESLVGLPLTLKPRPSEFPMELAGKQAIQWRCQLWWCFRNWETVAVLLLWYTPDCFWEWRAAPDGSSKTLFLIIIKGFVMDTACAEPTDKNKRDCRRCFSISMWSIF